MQIAYDRHSMIIDGRREFIRSGAMHYFRLPSVELWRDRLFKLKAAGYNTVDLYFNWGFHSKNPGEYDFTGIRDVKKLLEITQELGLWVIARPGPYINAEVSGGGFPMWLLAMKDLPLRNRRNGAFVWSDEYMAYVREWWEQILPYINAAPNVLMCQIENEYSTQEMEPDTMRAHADLARELGVKVPLSHNDLFFAGLYADIVDLYGFDNYSVTSFDQDWRKIPTIFGVLDNIERSLRPFCENRPLMVAELQAGWFGTWTGPSYDQIIERLGREHIAIVTKTLFAQGLTVFNHYKAIGGTNWDYLGGVESYTSYDFAAPIAETGLNTERLYEAKSLNNFLASFDLSTLDRVDPPVPVTPENLLFSVRKDVQNENTHWFFLRNLTDKETEAQIDNAYTVTLKPHDMLILPWHVKLLGGDTLKCATAELMYQTKNLLVFEGDRPLTADFITAATPGTSHDNIVWEKNGEGHKFTCMPPVADSYYTAKLGELNILVLGAKLMDTFWVHNANTLVLGPESHLAENQYGVRQDAQSERTLHIVHTQLGQITEKKVPKVNPPALAPLQAWVGTMLNPVDLDVKQFQPASDTALDFDANKQYEGCGWYAIPLKSKIKTASILARHIWAMYANDQFIASGNNLEIVYGEDPVGPTTVGIPSSAFKPGDNYLYIYVDSLGHYKGFHDDGQIPQGLIELELDGKSALDPDVKILFAGNQRWRNESQPLAALPKDGAPFVRLETKFELPAHKINDMEYPVGIDLGEPDNIERINIILNGELVGRWWTQCKSQHRFYLPDGILKREGTNTLALEFFCAECNITPETLEKTLFPIRLFAYDYLTRVDV